MFFIKNKIIHHDIKLANIVYNITTGDAKFIDFGLMTTKEKFIEQSIKSENGLAITWDYFPPEIINWFCDDWINDIYKHMNRFKPLHNHICINVGGKPRYDINDDPTYMTINTRQKHKVCKQHCLSIIKRDIERLIQNAKQKM